MLEDGGYVCDPGRVAAQQSLDGDAWHAHVRLPGGAELAVATRARPSGHDTIVPLRKPGREAPGPA